MSRNEQGSATDCGCGALSSTWMFLGAVTRPLCEKITPKKLILGLFKSHWVSLKWVHNQPDVVGLDTAWDCVLFHWLICCHRCFQCLVCQPVFTLSLCGIPLLSSWKHLAKGIFHCGCMIGSTVLSISSLICRYLWLPMPLNTFWCLLRMRYRVAFGVEVVLLHSQLVLPARGVRTADILWYNMCWISGVSGGSVIAWTLICIGLSRVSFTRAHFATTNFHLRLSLKCS